MVSIVCIVPMHKTLVNVSSPCIFFRCEQCPPQDSAAFAKLCPKGSGFLQRKDINECTDLAGMCQNGRCKNTIGSYQCRCNQGYTLDEAGVSCHGKPNVPLM